MSLSVHGDNNARGKTRWVTGFAGLLFVLFLAAHVLLPVKVVFATNVAATKHNLSVTGAFTVTSLTETRICVFCHTPHHAVQSGVAGIDYPLWNHSLSSQSYTLYDSATLESPTSPAIQPDGDSRLCLSCHDGTVAIGSVVNLGGSPATISMDIAGSGGRLDAQGRLTAVSSSYMGTDLSGHHPISIAVNQPLLDAKDTQCSASLISWRVCFPASGDIGKMRPTNNQYNLQPGVSLGGSYSGGVQCSSCHDPHEDPVVGTTVFLRGAPAVDRNNTDALCTSCHLDCADACP